MMVDEENVRAIVDATTRIESQLIEGFARAASAFTETGKQWQRLAAASPEPEIFEHWLRLH